MTKAEAYEKAWRIAFKNNDFSLADEIYHPEYSAFDFRAGLEVNLDSDKVIVSTYGESFRSGPFKKIFENDYVLSFHDINPQKKIHALVIPKGEYIDLDDFNKKASDKEITEFHKAVSHVSNLLGVTDKGYRVLSNIGSDGGQEVPHLHFHIFAGEKIGKMVV